MKVYRINCDRTNYQYFLIEEEEYLSTRDGECLMRFGKYPDDWKFPKVYIPEPQLSVPDFYALGFAPDYFIVNQRAYDHVGALLEMSGQVFDFQYKGETFRFFHPTYCFDCLDEERCVWRHPEEKLGGIVKYEFIPGRLMFEIPIITAPQENSATLFALEGNQEDEEYELKYNVDRYGLKGLRIEEVWNDETGGIMVS